jgi:hypothetical protein
MVPATSIVTNESGCNVTQDYHGESIPIQKLKLDTEHGLTISFSFTNDSRLGAPYQQSYMAMYAIVVAADYHSMHDFFPDAEGLYSKKCANLINLHIFATPCITILFYTIKYMSTNVICTSTMMPAVGH